MNEVYWVLPGQLAGRAGPGEHPWDLEELWGAGFRSIVSLALIDGKPIRAAGFRHLPAPLNGGLAMFPLLRRLLVRRMVPVVAYISSELEAERPTLVHCRQGRDRTGAVLATFLVHHQGCSPDEAVRRVREVNSKAMVSSGFDRLPWVYASLKVPNQ